MIEYQDFERVEVRVGRIVEAELLQNAKYTTHKLVIDFGPEIGRKASGARVNRYDLTELAGKLVVAVVNMPARRIGTLDSQVLTLGVPDADGECALLAPDKDVPLGGKMY